MSSVAVEAAPVNLQPSSERPLRILALDGGGVRGLSELVILQSILHTADFSNPDKAVPTRPSDYFDLICGTSTGGLIALMLGRLRMTIPDCLRAYMSISEKVFDKTRILKGSKFDHNLFVQQVQELLKSNNFVPDERLPDQNSSCKTFVVAVHSEGGGVAHLRTYSQKHERATDCAIWEAVRATTAAPGYFDEITIQDPGNATLRTFIDGGVGYNNPAECAIEEAKQIWPHRPIAAALFIKDKITECETVHNRMYTIIPPNNYFRFSVDHLGSVGLEDWKELGKLNSLTHQYMCKPDIRSCKEKCVALLLTLTNGIKFESSDSEIVSAEAALKLALEEMRWDRNFVRGRLDDVVNFYETRKAPDQVHAWKAYVFNSLCESDGMDIELAKLAIEIARELGNRAKYREGASWSEKAVNYLERLGSPVNELQAVWEFAHALYLLASGDEINWRQHYSIAKDFRYPLSGESILIPARDYLISEQFVRRLFLDEAEEHLARLWNAWYQMDTILHGQNLRLMIGLYEGYRFRQDSERENKWFKVIVQGMERHGLTNEAFRHFCVQFAEEWKTGQAAPRNNVPGSRLTNTSIAAPPEGSDIFEENEDLYRMLQGFKHQVDGTISTAPSNGPANIPSDPFVARETQTIPRLLGLRYRNIPLISSKIQLESLRRKMPPNTFTESLLSSILKLLRSDPTIHEKELEKLLMQWSEIMMLMDYSIENTWTVVDLLRAALGNKRVSNWFITRGGGSLGRIIKRASISGGDGMWQLHLVTIRLIANIFSAEILKYTTLQPFWDEIINSLTSGLVAPKLPLVKAATYAIFNLTQLLLKDSVALDEDSLIRFVVGIVQALRSHGQLLSGSTDMEFIRFLVICLGGMVIIGERSNNSVKRLLVTLEAKEVISKVAVEEGKEVINLLEM